MGSRTKNPAKLENPLTEARKCIEEGRYTATYHAKVRQIERMVPLPDVLHAIENGRREKKRDRYDEAYKSWSYSIRGKATDKRDLRIVISFDEDTELLIITVIVLGVLK